MKRKYYGIAIIIAVLFDIMINENRSEIDYKDYVTIEMKPSEILFDKTTVEQTIDNEFCNIVYYVIIENITDENINIILKILIPDELTSTMIYGEPSLGPRPKYIELKPGEKIDIAHGTLLKHMNRLREAEKEIFEKYKDTLYIELLINDKKSYCKINALSDSSDGF